MLYKALTVWQFREWEVSIWTGPYRSMEEAEVYACYGLCKLEWNSERNALDLYTKDNLKEFVTGNNGDQSIQHQEGNVIKLVDENVSLRRVRSGSIRKSNINEENMEDVFAVMADYQNLFECSNPTFSSVSYGVFEITGKNLNTEI